MNDAMAIFHTWEKHEIHLLLRLSNYSIPEVSGRSRDIIDIN